MMGGSVKDEIARLRAEARHFRDLAKLQRERVRAARLGRRWVDKMRAEDRVREYVRAAQDRDARVKELRAQFRPAERGV